MRGTCAAAMSRRTVASPIRLSHSSLETAVLGMLSPSSSLSTYNPASLFEMIDSRKRLHFLRASLVSRRPRKFAPKEGPEKFLHMILGVLRRPGGRDRALGGDTFEPRSVPCGRAPQAPASQDDKRCSIYRQPARFLQRPASRARDRHMRALLRLFSRPARQDSTLPCSQIVLRPHSAQHIVRLRSAAKFAIRFTAAPAPNPQMRRRPGLKHR